MTFNRKAYMQEYNKRYYADNKSYWEKRYLDSPEKFIDQSKEWSQTNKEKRNAISQKWRDNNRSDFRSSCKSSREKNMTRVLANNAKRRALRLKCTVAWADEKKIQGYYDLAKFFEWITLGIKYHVDHIIPLQGKEVCGLHTHDNLQILRADQNLKKLNKLELIYG
jgi:hypothetical protein